MRLSLTFVLDEDVTPDLFAEKVARACSAGTLRPGEGILVPSDPERQFRITDEPLVDVLPFLKDRT